MSVNEKVARSVALEQAYVHDVYEQFCDNPRSKPWPRVQQFLETLDPGSIVCDVGCGNGKYLNVNTSIFNIGGEKCTRLSDVAREKDNEVLTLDNLSLPFRDESLDAVLSIAVVHHFATTERRVCALRELARVLRIGGRLIISVWAMEQSHRKFESQDVLVPWHRPQHLSTPSLELTSTTNTSDDDGPTPYHAYTQSDTDSNKSSRGKSSVKKRGKTRHKGRSIDPKRNSSPSSSSLSSPNETCYSFVRRAIQKLAGGKRVGVHRPWFLESWTACTKDIPPKRYDPDGCECCDENVQDLPIELRRVDDEEMMPQRRQTFPSSQIFNDIYNNLKSRSMTNIKTVENNNIVRSQSSVPSIQEAISSEATSQTNLSSTNTLSKPKLVKQKKSICEEESDEELDKPTEMSHLPESKIFNTRYNRINVLKQRSLNEELMSAERLREKERLKQNIQKQASLNENLIYHRHHTFDSLKDSFFSVSTAKRFQLIKTGFTKKIKSSTTNIEKVTGASLKNGFVRMFQNWTSSELISPSVSEDDAFPSPKKIPVIEEIKESTGTTERRHSKEDGSDSSKDSSLQSDTSVDSEDSFASVIFVPKSDPMSPNLSPGPTSPRVSNSSVPNSPRIKQSSCPTSPRIKQMPLSVYPLTKQLSSPKPSTTVLSPTETSCSKKLGRDQTSESKTPEVDGSSSNKKAVESLAQKYAVQQIPKFKNTTTTTTRPVNSEKTTTPKETTEAKEKAECLKEIKDLLNKKPGFGVRASKTNFPIVRHSSVNNGKLEAVAKPLPKLLSLELFNPETDDKDSDSSAVSSPDSIDSVISVHEDKTSSSSGPPKTKFNFPDNKKECTAKTLLEAAADVANSLDEAVDKVIRSSPRARRREIKAGEVMSVMQRQYSTETTPLLSDDFETSWNDECHKHLTDFADKLSEKLLHEIDQYQVQSRKMVDHINDPYIHRLSEELQDLSKLSAEIQKQNEYLAKLSASDKLFPANCSKCKSIICKCSKSNHNNNNNNNNNSNNYARTLSETVKASSRDLRLSKTNTTKMADKVQVSVDGGVKNSELRDSRTDVDAFSNLDRFELKSIDSAELDSLVKSLNKNSIKTGTSIESCDSEKGSSPNSMQSSVTASSHFGHSIESAEGFSDRGSTDKDTNSISRYSDGGSTASLASCPEWKVIRNKLPNERSLSEDKTEPSKASGSKRKNQSGLDTSLSDTSQESLPSDNIGGEIMYHRYYHVFKEGELDQLIEKYVENLHIISSYYDHTSWCIVAEKVQVWTI